VDLRSLFSRLRRRPPSGERVELKPLEQVALSYLLRFGSASTSGIQAELDARSSVLAPDANDVMTALIVQGLVQARIEPQEGRSSTIFVPSAKGQRLKGILPSEPSVVTEFWL
jgi:hypothetical protein